MYRRKSKNSLSLKKRNGFSGDPYGRKPNSPFRISLGAHMWNKLKTFRQKSQQIKNKKHIYGCTATSIIEPSDTIQTTSIAVMKTK